jgi:hypothetical protein
MSGLNSESVMGSKFLWLMTEMCWGLLMVVKKQVGMA